MTHGGGWRDIQRDRWGSTRLLSHSPPLPSLSISTACLATASLKIRTKASLISSPCGPCSLGWRHRACITSTLSILGAGGGAGGGGGAAARGVPARSLGLPERLRNARGVPLPRLPRLGPPPVLRASPLTLPSAESSGSGACVAKPGLFFLSVLPRLPGPNEPRRVEIVRDRIEMVRIAPSPTVPARRRVATAAATAPESGLVPGLVPRVLPGTDCCEPREGAREAGSRDAASLEVAAEQAGGRGGGSWEEVEEERREAIELDAV